MISSQKPFFGISGRFSYHESPAMIPRHLQMVVVAKNNSSVVYHISLILLCSCGMQHLVE